MILTWAYIASSTRLSFNFQKFLKKIVAWSVRQTFKIRIIY